MKLIKKILNLFGRNSENQQAEIEAQPINETKISVPKDEIVGVWENDLDDGSGLHAIWGWSYKFNENGTGIYYSWSDSKIDDELLFLWERVGANTIRAKFPDDETWDTIEYTMEIVPAPYAGSIMKLTDNNFTQSENGREGFWTGYGAVYRKV